MRILPTGCPTQAIEQTAAPGQPGRQVDEGGLQVFQQGHQQRALVPFWLRRAVQLLPIVGGLRLFLQAAGEFLVPHLSGPGAVVVLEIGQGQGAGRKTGVHLFEKLDEGAGVFHIAVEVHQQGVDGIGGDVQCLVQGAEGLAQHQGFGLHAAMRN